MQAINASCRRTYTAAHDSGPRPTSALRWIVLHCTQGPSAVSAAVWAENPDSSGSFQIVVDDDSCFRVLEDGRIPEAAPGANTAGIHIEQAGYAGWTEAEWKAHDLTLRRAAYKAAMLSGWYGIPLRWVGWVGLKLGRKGVTTHADCTKAFGGDHTDPGAGYPKTLFMQYAKMYAKQIGNV